MHFGKTVLASAAAAMPASGNTTPTAEKFADSISRQHASASPANGNSFISFNPAHPDAIFRAPEDTAQGAQGSLFEKNPSFAELGQYARAGLDVGSSGGRDILMNRALRAEALNVLKLYAEGKLEENIPVLQEAQDYSSSFMADTIAASAIDIMGLREANPNVIEQKVKILGWIAGIFKKDSDFTQGEDTIKSLYENEAKRQQVDPLTPHEREELLREINAIEQENEHSGTNELKAFVRHEAETAAMSWLINQVQHLVLSRFPALR